MDNLKADIQEVIDWNTNSLSPFIQDYLPSPTLRLRLSDRLSLYCGWC